MMKTRRVLVTFASKRGGTAGIAELIAETLRGHEFLVDVMPVDTVTELSQYDGVVVGGALYMMRWLRAARRFVRRNTDALRELPVWMFSSGPLDDSATHRDVSPTRAVAALIRRIGARGHATFGGRLAADARGFPAAQMAKERAGDWRDRGQIERWANEVAADLSSLPERTAGPRRAPAKPYLLAAICLLVGITAIAGGIGLVGRPDGSAVGLPLDVLAHSPFRDFLIPGLLLLVVIGIGSTIAGTLALWRGERAAPICFVAGGALLIWIVTQMLMLRTINPLQIGCFAAALSILGLTRPHGVMIKHLSTSPRFKRV